MCPDSRKLLILKNPFNLFCGLSAVGHFDLKRERFPFAVILLQLFAFPLLSQEISSHLQPQYVYKMWDNKNGLPQNTVFDIVEDEHGYIWSATEEGLVRFDGHEFQIINDDNTTGLFSNSFYDMQKTADGFYATSRNTVLEIKKNTRRSFDFRNEIEGSWITALVQDLDGQLVVGTNAGDLLAIKNDSIVRYSAWKSPEPIQVLGLHEGGILIGTSSGLFRMTNSGQTTIPVDGFESRNIRTLAMPNDGSVWIGTKEHGLWHITGATVRNYLESDGLPENFVSSLSFDAEGKLWIGTSHSGLYTLFNDKIQPIEKEGFANDAIKSILRGRDGIIWVGTAGLGLMQLKRAEVLMVPDNFHLSGNVILPIYQHSNGDIWVGTAGSGVNRIRNGVTTYYHQRDGLSHEIVLSICGTKEAVYFGTANGLDRLNLSSNRIDRHYKTKDGLASNIIQAIFEDSGGRIWISTRSGGLHYLEDDVVRPVSLPYELRNAELTCILEDHNKNLWVGSSDGIIMLDQKTNEPTHYSPAKGLPISLINGMYEDSEGAIWFACDGGLLRFAGNKFSLFTKSNGLPSNRVYYLVSDDEGNLWMSSFIGLQRITKPELDKLRTATGSVKVRVDLFDTMDGMANSEMNGGVFPAGWKMNDNTLWFPTVMGIAVVDPQLIDDNKKEIPILIQSLKYGDTENFFPEDTRIPAGVSNIEFKYSSINFTKPRTLNFHFRLQGLSDEWKPAGNRRTAYFTSLPPGDYIFEVKAEQQGVFSKAAAFPFSVEPFFYETYWFRGLLVALLFFAGFVAKQYHSKYREEFRLKALVEERTSELRNMNERLVRVNKEIEEQNHKLREIAWVQSHRVRTPLSRILGLIGLLEEDMLKKEDQELLSMVRKSCEELDIIIHDIVDKTQVRKENEEST